MCGVQVHSPPLLTACGGVDAAVSAVFRLARLCCTVERKGHLSYDRECRDVARRGRNRREERYDKTWRGYVRRKRKEGINVSMQTLCSQITMETSSVLDFLPAAGKVCMEKA